MRIRFLAVTIILLAAIGANAQTAMRQRAVRVGGGEPIPALYQDLYLNLSRQLPPSEDQPNPLEPKLGPQPVYAADLLPANGNRGTDLLQPTTIGGVRAFLDRFQQLGIRGVVFPIGYPLLIDRFPRSAEYLQFYKQVMAEIRKRNMTVDIESSVMFANSPFSTVQWDYSATPFAQFVQERHVMIATIVAQLAPDYLNLGSEPDTEAKLTGYAQLNTVGAYAQYIGQILQGIDRGGAKMGTGLGTWNNPAFVQAECALPIDFISLHIYPVDDGSISTAYQAAGIARGAGKELIIDEAWLFKARQGESTSIAADAAVFARDAFSFFAPLDQRFLQLVDRFSRAQGVTFLSAFWSTYLFAYIPYSPSLESMSYNQIVQQVNALASQNIVNGQFSATGKYYGDLIAGRR